jgi:uncharacterized protein YutE (UPF0331/DUF86 family)
MPVDPDVVRELLAALRDYISRLERMEFQREELLKDIDRQDLVSHRLHTAVEAMIDISMHLASGLNLPKRHKASDVIALLGEEGILSSELTQRLTKAPAARNVMVHEYYDVDYELIADNYEDNILDLKDFAREITQYLQQEDII